MRTSTISTPAIWTLGELAGEVGDHFVSGAAHLILFVFVTAGWRALRLNPNDFVVYPLPPLVAVLLVIAVVGLLVTGRYPKGLYDFVIGINRWSIRVRAYSTLLRDEYPPFPLDMGPRESVAAVYPNPLRRLRHPG